MERLGPGVLRSHHGLHAVQHLEAAAPEGGQVVGVQVDVVADEPAAAGRLEAGLPVENGDDGREMGGVAPGAAGRVQRTSARRPVEEPPDDGLLDSDQGVAGSVVDRRPERAARGAPRSAAENGGGDR